MIRTLAQRKRALLARRRRVNAALKAPAGERVEDEKPPNDGSNGSDSASTRTAPSEVVAAMPSG
jgi:hypothetical protein